MVSSLLSGVLLAGFAACAPAGSDPPTAPSPAASAPTASTSPAPSSTPRPEDAQTAVDRLFSAGVSGDRPSWDLRTDTDDPSFATRSALLFDNLGALSLTRLRVRLTGAEQKVPADRQRVLGVGARIVQAQLVWRVAGETADATSTVWLTLAPGPSGLRLAGTDDGSGLDTPALPLWWLSPVTRETRGTATVLVGPGQDAGRWAALARRAAVAAGKHLPHNLREHWDGRLVVEVPGSGADFTRVLGAAPGAYAGTAAVTRPEGPDTRAAIRVVVNPATATDSDDELGTTLSHETVHVATRSARSPAPVWAVEGLAEYVALEAHPGQRTAEIAALRTASLPTRLPPGSAFTAGGKDVTASYAQAWLACKTIAEHTSRSDLGRFYAALGEGRSVEKAARSTLGVDDAVVVDWWRGAMASAAATGRG